MYMREVFILQDNPTRKSGSSFLLFQAEELD